MPIARLTPIDLQELLIEHGFDLPRYGADGDWGQESESACDDWFESGDDLAIEAVPAPPPEGIVPLEWMPDCAMDRIIIHWTAGSYACSETDKEHYHIIVDGNGKLWRGDNSITANVSTNDNDGYAAHTKSCNTKSIGISACCMAGAIESPFNAGAYPLKQSQWESLVAVAADLCEKYDIPVTPSTVLQHGEVEETLGIVQSGKWDINKLPWSVNTPPNEVGDLFRSLVSERL